MSSSTMRFEILGPLRVWRDDSELDVGPAQQRLLLAVLLAHAGRPVSPTELAETLWGEDTPPSATNLIHRYVGTLRRLFEPELPPRQAGRWLLRETAGYRMDVDDTSLDLARCRQLATRARTARRADPSADHTDAFLDALALWHGRCAEAVGSADVALFRSVDGEYTALLRDAADQAIAHGGGDGVLPLLRTAAHRDPFDEGVHARLIRVLAALGNQAEALRVHQAVRARLVGELGIEPGAELDDAHRAVLTPSTAPPPAPPRPTPEPATEPALDAVPARHRLPVAQLPADLASFTGRDAELTAMWQVLDAQRDTVPMIAIDGLPGSGKTTLAVHWSSQASERFPDGQLYVNLRGFDAHGLRVAPAQALAGFLVALGLSAERVPPDVDMRAALYRGLLADRRVLVVLDNAADADQVRPLLPSSAGCAVVITSRVVLLGTLTHEDAHPISLGALTHDEAHTLLARRLGADRIAREPGAVTEIIDRCGRLPLALAVVAARAATNPGFTLTAISRALADVEFGLDAFADGDVKTVLSWSYRALSEQAARTFRYLGLAHGPDVSIEAAANLVGGTVREARGTLAELTRARLVTEHRPGRYVLHDLLKLYAEELAGTHDPMADRRAAVERMTRWYTEGALAATEQLLPLFRPFETEPADLPCPPPAFEDYAQALAWCEAEQSNVVAATTTAMAHGLYRAAWQLPLAFYGFFSLRRDQTDWVRTYEIAVRATHEDGDREREARMLGNLGNSHVVFGEFDTAISYYEKALALFGELGDRCGEATALANIAHTRRKAGRTADVLPVLMAALAIYEEIGDPDDQAYCLLIISATHCELGDYDETERYGQRALELFGQAGGERYRGHVLANLAIARLHKGDHESALALSEESVALLRETSDQHELITVLRDLARTYDVTGRGADAEAARREALAIAVTLDDVVSQEALRALLPDEA